MDFLKKRIKTPSGWTMFVFGVLALLLGFAGIVWPESILLQLGFETALRDSRPSFDYTIVFITASSMASFNIGVYYILASLNDLRQFYKWTVPFRGLTFIVFTTLVLTGSAPGRFMIVAVWELLGGLATGLTLYSESKST